MFARYIHAFLLIYCITPCESSGRFFRATWYFIYYHHYFYGVKNKQRQHTNGISIELDWAGENSIDSDYNTLRTCFSHRLLQVLHRLWVNAASTSNHCTSQSHSTHCISWPHSTVYHLQPSFSSCRCSPSGTVCFNTDFCTLDGSSLQCHLRTQCSQPHSCIYCSFGCCYTMLHTWQPTWLFPS